MTMTTKQAMGPESRDVRRSHIVHRDGYLPCRVVLHRTTTMWVTHMEALQPDGRWSRMWGHYHADRAAAEADYAERVERLFSAR